MPHQGALLPPGPPLAGRQLLGPPGLTPTLPGVPVLMGPPSLAQLQAPVYSTPSLPDRDKPEGLTRWRRAGRLINTPLSVGADLYRAISLQTAPRTWDILTQRREVSFIDILQEQGYDERTARWTGLALDLILDPLNYIGIGLLGKTGKLAKGVRAGAQELKGILGKTIKPISFLNEAESIKRTFGGAYQVEKGSQFAKDVASAIAKGANLEFGQNWVEQAARGQRALFTLDVPFTNMKGISIVPREISMAAFAIPTYARKAFVGVAKRVVVPGTEKSFADVGAAMFRRGSGDPILDKVGLVFRGLLKARESRLAEDLRPAIVARSGLDSKDLDRLGEIFEKKIPAKALVEGTVTPEMLLKAGTPKALAGNKNVGLIMEKLRKIMTESLTQEQFNKLPVSALMDPGLNYMTRVITPEGRKLMAKAKLFENTSRVFGTNHGSMIQRISEFRGKTVGDINRMAQEGKLPFAPGQKIKKFFETDPVVIAGVRARRAVRTITGAQYLNSFAETAVARGLAKKIPDSLQGKGRARALAELSREGFASRSSSPLLSRYAFKDPGLVAEVDKHFSKFSQIESVTDFGRFWDASMNWMKSITLPIFPAFHLRNKVDNAWRNYLAGAMPIHNYYAELGLGHYGEKGKALLGKKVFRNPSTGEMKSLDELANAAQNLGIIGQNARDVQHMMDDPEAFYRDLKAGNTEKWKNLINPNVNKNTVIRAGWDFGQHFVENPDRFALFIARWMKGDTLIDAAETVMKFHFDPSNITDFERMVPRRGFFFYNFIRNNLPLQFEMAMSRPGKFGLPFKIERSKIIPDLLGRNLEPIKSKFISEWVREGSPFFMGRDPDNPDQVRILMLDGWSSSSDLLKLFDPGKYFINNLIPFLREPLALAQNYDFFFREPIVANPDFPESLSERTDFMKMSLPKQWVHVMRNIRAFNEADQMMTRMSDPKTDKVSLAARVFLGGSSVLSSDREGMRRYSYRMEDIAKEGRRLYLKALRRGRPEEAVKLQKIYFARLARGW